MVEEQVFLDCKDVLVFSEFEVIMVFSEDVDILIFSEVLNILDEAAEGCCSLGADDVFVR